MALWDDLPGTAGKAFDATKNWGSGVKVNFMQSIYADNNSDRLLATSSTTDTALTVGTAVAGLWELRGVGAAKSVAGAEEISLNGKSVDHWDNFTSTTVDHFNENPGFAIVRNFNTEAFQVLGSDSTAYVAKGMAESSVKTDGICIRIEQTSPEAKDAIKDFLRNSDVYSVKTLNGVDYLAKAVNGQAKIIVSDPDLAYLGKTEAFFDPIPPKSVQFGSATESQVEHIVSINTKSGIDAFQHGPQSNIGRPFEAKDFPMTAMSSDGVTMLNNQSELNSYLAKMIRMGHKF